MERFSGVMSLRLMLSETTVALRSVFSMRLHSSLAISSILAGLYTFCSAYISRRACEVVAS